MATFNTLLLDRTAWDLVLDVTGNIALAAPPYAISQDVATAAQTFLGELWYDQNDGVPYLDELLGFAPPLSVLIAALTTAAMGVSGVVSAQTVITAFDRANRIVTGQIQFVDENGVSGVVNV